MKMVLIPESEYHMLLEKNPMKAKLTKVLRGKPTQEKATEMSQMMGRYLRSQPKKPTALATKGSHILSNVLAHFPPLYHNKINMLLSELMKYGARVTEKKELVLKTGDVVTNSNIVDLLKEALVPTKRKERDIPHGWKYFIQEILNANIPQSVFTKKSTREDLQEELEWESY